LNQQEITDRKELIKSIQNRFMDVRCAQVEQLLSVMSNPLRFHLFCALSEAEFSVSELVEVTGAKLSNLSQQLKIMTMAGYLEKERRGKEILYKLKDHRILQMLQYLESIFT
jgi:DNA-binding transcriptional ArsR family regulator